MHLYLQQFSSSSQQGGMCSLSQFKLLCQRVGVLAHL